VALWPAIHNVSGYNYLIWLNTFEVGQDCLQRRDIAMNVGDDRQRGRVLLAQLVYPSISNLLAVWRRA
jgi:hypothetical protein